MAHHTTNSQVAGGITTTVCLAQCVMMMAGSSFLINDPVFAGHSYQSFVEDFSPPVSQFSPKNSKASSVLAFLKGPIQPLRPRHRTRRRSWQARIQEKAALSCWRRRRPHAIGRRWSSATPVIAVPTTVLATVVREVERGGWGRGIPPPLH